MSIAGDDKRMLASPVDDRNGRAMATTTPRVELENERVRVTRIRREGGGELPPASRHDRLIIYLEGGHLSRKEGGRREELRRKTGEVVWRRASQHQVEVLDDAPHEVLIVEFKS